MELELQVFNYTPELLGLVKLDVEVTLDELELNPMTFYNIDGISPYIENEIEYTIIFSSGREFISPIHYEALKDVVREARKY